MNGAVDDAGAGSNTDADLRYDASFAGDVAATRTPREALFDPNRPSAPYECPGDPLTARALVGIFPTGLGHSTWHELPHLIGTRHYQRRCAPIVGCGGWTAQEEHAVVFSLVISSEGALRMTPQEIYFAAGDESSLGPFTNVDEGDVFIENLRIRFTDVGGQLCASAASALEVSTDDRGYSIESFLAGRVEVGFRSHEGSNPERAPAWTFECDGGPGSDAEIRSGWFHEGTDVIWLSARPDEMQLARRYCHPATGCSQWDQGPWSVGPYALRSDDEGLALMIEGEEGESLLRVVNGHFSGIDGDGNQLTGFINNHCVQTDAAQDYDLIFDSRREERARTVVRGSQSSDQPT